MNLPRIVQRLWSSPPSSPSTRQLEQHLRRELEELERQSVSFNEAIGLLRAGLSLSSDVEQDERQRIPLLQEVCSQLQHDPEREPLAQLSLSFAAQSLQHHFIQTHILRNLYNQVLEAKRRFLHHWHARLDEQIERLPNERRRLLKAQLENCFQTILTAGVKQMEARYRSEFRELLAQEASAHLPSEEESQTTPLRSIEEALRLIEQELLPPSEEKPTP